MLDVDKPVKTRDGRSARIVCRDCRGPFPIVALVATHDGAEDPRLFTAEGQYWLGTYSYYDLVNDGDTQQVAQGVYSEPQD